MRYFLRHFKESVESRVRVSKNKKRIGGVRLEVAAETYTNAAQSVYENEQERIKLPDPLIAGSSSSIHKTRQEKWMGRDSNSRPPVCETGILTRLDHPSSNECSFRDKYED